MIEVGIYSIAHGYTQCSPDYPMNNVEDFFPFYQPTWGYNVKYTVIIQVSPAIEVYFCLRTEEMDNKGNLMRYYSQQIDIECNYKADFQPMNISISVQQKT